MAVATTVSAVDRFCRRSLDPETFNRLRCVEPCLVGAAHGKPTYKFVLLTDDTLFLTENPPKRVTPAMTLRNIRSIALVRQRPSYRMHSGETCVGLRTDQ